MKEKEYEKKEFLEIYFVFNDWSIECRKHQLQRFQTTTDKEKIDISKNMALSNLFMLRRGVDPSINAMFWEETRNNKKEKFSVNKRIMEILIKVLDFPLFI